MPIKFMFNPPQTDELLKDITALKGIGQWVESVWELKLIGGYVEPGQPDPVLVDVVLRAYVEQIRERNHTLMKMNEMMLTHKEFNFLQI